MMELLNVIHINSIIKEIPFVNLIESFKLKNLIIKGRIEIVNIKELKEKLVFSVEIYPQYPLKYHDSETIRFINKDLIKYNHVMECGSICIHTIHSTHLEEKINIDFQSLKDWIFKYYINKDKDNHYEHIILNPSLVDNKYYSYQFTNLEGSFDKNDFGYVNYTILNKSIIRTKPIINNLVQSFDRVYYKTLKCNWSTNYMKNFDTSIGLFVFVEDIPASYQKFAFKNWIDFKGLFSKCFLNFLSKFKDANSIKKPKLIFPIFIGYKTIHNEIHWITTMCRVDDFPIQSIKVDKESKTQLISKNIEWAITKNSSYKYFFGRGRFCDELTNSKILLIGVGAIGSMVAKTLVKCGAKHLTLVDYDIKEPENVCRSEYSFSTGFTSKVEELRDVLITNSPFVEVLTGNEYYFERKIKLLHKEKKSKEVFEKTLSEFDLIFDCSTDNDLMYILNSLNFKGDLINMSMTNHANDLVCAYHPNIYDFVNRQFNDILKNDVEDLYSPTGCWSPTFKASYNDINVLVQYALKQINLTYLNKKIKNNFTISFDESNHIKLREY